MRLLLLYVLAMNAIAQAPVWKFAVSGDSRNCGNVVMPAIAQGVRDSGAQFYWHLGDFRAQYDFDEDMRPPAKLGIVAAPMNISTYQARAWPAFIEKQLTPFGNVPVFLAIGNHETIPVNGREQYLTQFADWLEAAPIREQRLKDDATDHKLRTYYHWIQGGVDFITLDNASTDRLEDAQLNWLKLVLTRAEADPEVHTVVTGMHAAFPGSVGESHSMSDWAQGDKSGRQAYQALWDMHKRSGKRVYVLASHSHFFMENVYGTETWKGKVLPGWIVGTAGAVRYQLPPATGKSRKAMTGVYGFLIGTVAADGAITFEFQNLALDDLLKANAGSQPEALVRWCFAENKAF